MLHYASNMLHNTSSLLRYTINMLHYTSNMLRYTINMLHNTSNMLRYTSNMLRHINTSFLRHHVISFFTKLCHISSRIRNGKMRNQKA